MRLSREGSDLLPCSIVPLKRSDRETLPSESPDSRSVMVRILIRPMRPVPLCTYSFLRGIDDPVSRNLPFPAPRSTSDRTASQMAGTSCHSSINLGSSPMRMPRGSDAAMSLPGTGPTASATLNSLREWFSAVQVLPHQRGPSMETAPKDSSIASTSASMSLGL